jgi:hypothetical protein
MVVLSRLGSFQQRQTEPMPSSIPDPHRPDPHRPPAPGLVSADESLEYSRQMVEFLRKMASTQGHRLLAQLLGLAQDEIANLQKDAG